MIGRNATTQPRRDLLRLGGTIPPSRYLAIGLLLTTVKIGIDNLVATRVFGRPWSPLNYAITGEIGGLFALDAAEQLFYVTMLGLALPFVVVGLVLTVRRLRDAGWPLWFVTCFFAPMPINVVFFILLSVVPPRSSADYGTLGDAGDVPPKAKAAKPPFSFGWAFAAILLPMPVAGAVAYFGTHVFGDYGWGLFAGLPFMLPMLSVVIYGFGREVTLGQSLSIAWLWLLVAVVALIATAFEGLICILMMLPLAAPVALLGALIGHCVVALGSRRPGDLGKVALVLVALLPAMVGAEHVALPGPLLFTCETSVEVDAPPEVVWRNVVSFSDLEPPDDWLFRAGVAYPIRARIEGTGAGAVRRCEFSTGAFVEPIEVWYEPRLLRFAVTSNPAPMREWNPFFEIHPPHLDGFLVSKRGQFELSPLAGGKTLLRGSTLYQHGLWPASYWRLWSDTIIHRIHDRVLGHIKTLSESR
ncbi:MAG TPA: hypothetical protein VGH33_07710 [Isosphaeraceae bacterium]